MSKELFTKSEKFKEEYSVRIHKIGDMIPVPNSDFLAYTVVSDETIVLRKDMNKPGDVLFYVTKECVINPDFLKKNNQYMYDYRELNENYAEVQSLIDESEKLKESEPEKSAELLEKSKRLVGYFNESGRVRIKELRGMVSSGYMFELASLLKWKPELKSYFDEHPIESFLTADDEADFMFDTIDGELFVWPYIPKTNTQQKNSGKKKSAKKEKKVAKFDRIIPEHFDLHYDTHKFGDNIFRIKPDDVVDISVKMHGTSVVICNVITRFPLKIAFYKRWYNKIVDNIGLKKYRITDTYEDFGNVYSTRNVVQNGTLDFKEGSKNAYYSHNVYSDINDIVKDFIPKGVSIYGEIVGFVSQGGGYVQKDYNYGCDRNGIDGPVNKLMIYRVSEELPNGKKKEYTVSEVVEFTKKLIDQLPDENKNRVTVIPVLYHGTLKELYPEISTENHWHENVLLAMKADKEHFGMEEKETLCVEEVDPNTRKKKKKLPPREGVVIRVEVPFDPEADVQNPLATDAFKLKTEAFAKKEAKEYDAGVVDMEVAGTDYSSPDDATSEQQQS
jgi:hypothetical protein